MSSLARINTLFVSEDWIRIYEAIQNVEFRAFDFDNLVEAILDFLRANFPEEFNDWVASSEFIMKVETLAWLSQNISFRIDLNTRENFLATAERRDSLIRLAQNVAFKVNRVRSATGQVRVERIRTNQALFDSNNVPLQDREIIWNDPANEDWFEQFITILNAAFTTRTQFGKPLARFRDGNTRIDQHLFNAAAPTTGSFPFAANVNGVSLPFEVINAKLNEETGQFEEFPPNPENSFNIFFRQDGRGLSSSGTGFFLPFKQGSLRFQDQDFTTPEIIRTETIDVQNINNDDFFVQELDEQGNVVADWDQVDTVFGESVSFNTFPSEENQIFELDTLENDRVRIRFGDGKFGQIPIGRFRFWFRTANPQPQVIKPSDVGLRSFTLPYVSNNSVFLLTITFALKEPVTNAASSETNFDIRTRANRVFFTQNRMITGKDYNQFFLKDNAIRKVKTVNRTFAGHSRFAKLNDPTGLYQNLKIVAEDGRLFQQDTLNIQFVSGDPLVLQPDDLIDNNIRPVLLKADKRLLYFNDYPEKFITDEIRWANTSVVAGNSRGNLTKNGSPVKVGDAATITNLNFVTTDAVLRLSDPKGPVVLVLRVVEDGDITDGVVLEQEVADNERIVSVFPAFRDRLTNLEAIEIENQLELKLDFGISWNQDQQRYQIITFDNLDKTSDFSLLNQGDTSGNGLDASWMILLEFIPGGQDEDQWQITDRGFGIFFESAREHDFFFANNEPILDPETGDVVNDSVVLLECNEAKDSLRRRQLPALSGLTCPLFCTEFQGDGTTTRFKTQENPLPPSSAVTIDGVLQSLEFDYDIIPDVSGDFIDFVNPPPADSQILVCVSEEFLNANVRVDTFVGDGSTSEFVLGGERVQTQNVIAFWDGVMQAAQVDFVTSDTGTNFTIQFSEQPPPLDVRVVVFQLTGIDSQIWSRNNFDGDDVETDFTIELGNQTEDTILVALDGVIQDPSNFTIISDANSTTVSFNTPPQSGVRIRIIGTLSPSFTNSATFSFDGDGVQSSFTLSGLIGFKPEGTIVAIDGVMQEGPWGTGEWSVTGGNKILFATPPADGTKITVFTVSSAVGVVFDEPGLDAPQATLDGNLGNLSTSSCIVNYIGEEVPFFVEDAMRHADGFVNTNGIQVRPADTDRSGFFDNPFVFQDIVLQDGFTDLVLWRKINEFGFTINDPINRLTRPRGTYGRSSVGDTAEGDSLGPDVIDGDIHLDVTTGTWLVANATDDEWQAASDQTAFASAIGRDHLKFIWKHFAPDAFRIDPSVSNVMDVFILTSSFDDAFRTALLNNEDVEDLPQPPTSEQLRIEFGDFLDFKAMSDAIVFHPTRFKILFGRQAEPELQATFKVVQTSGSQISENDLKLRILSAIDEFFNVDNFEFGETFYLTELIAFIHQELAPEVQSVVAVPKGDQAFGRGFQVRSEPDELFVSAANTEDIEVVTSLTDEELRIGTFVV